MVRGVVEKLLRMSIVLPTFLQAGRGFAVSIATWRVYRRPGQPGGSFTGRRNAPTFTSASTPALSGTSKAVGRWVDPLGLHFTINNIGAKLVPTLVPGDVGASFFTANFGSPRPELLFNHPYFTPTSSRLLVPTLVPFG